MGWMGLRGDCGGGHVPAGASHITVVVLYPVGYCVMRFCQNRNFSSSNSLTIFISNDSLVLPSESRFSFLSPNPFSFRLFHKKHSITIC